MKTLALIPARAGSKGVPNKNIRLFRGLPLMAWAIKVGLETCDRTVVSTDGDDIAAIARHYGAEVLMRPAELATDEAPMLPVVRHALKDSDAEVVVLLQPSSPSAARAAHVVVAIRMLVKLGVDSVASVVEIPDIYSPWAALLISGRDQLLDTFDQEATLCSLPTRRQDLGPTYYRDGTVYVLRRAILDEGRFYGTRCAPCLIPTAQSCTIDTEADWLAAEAKHA